MRCKYSALLPRIKDPKLMTLTWKSVPFLDKTTLLKCRSDWRRLIRRKPFTTAIRGGIYSWEVTHSNEGWHIHIHVFMDASYIPYKFLSQTWKQITKDSYITDIRQVKTNRRALDYVLKYVSKVPEIQGLRDQYNTAFRDVRLYGTFGSFYAFRPTKEPCKCPNCGECCWVDLDWLSRQAGWHSPDSLPPDICMHPPPPSPQSLPDMLF